MTILTGRAIKYLRQYNENDKMRDPTMEHVSNLPDVIASYRTMFDKAKCKAEFETIDERTVKIVLPKGWNWK